MPPECYGVLSGQVNEAPGGPKFQFSLPADGTHSEIGPPASLEKPVSPRGREKIRDVVESGSWQLRHLAGPCGWASELARIADRREMGGLGSETSLPPLQN